MAHIGRCGPYHGTIAEIPLPCLGKANGVGEIHLQRGATAGVIGHPANRTLNAREHPLELELYLHRSEIALAAAAAVGSPVHGCDHPGGGGQWSGKVAGAAQAVGADGRVDGAAFVKPAGPAIHMVTLTALLAKIAPIQETGRVFLYHNEIEVAVVGRAFDRIRRNGHTGGAGRLQVKTITGQAGVQCSSPSGYIYVLTPVNQEGHRRNVGYRFCGTIDGGIHVSGKIRLEFGNELFGSRVGETGVGGHRP